MNSEYKKIKNVTVGDVLYRERDLKEFNVSFANHSLDKSEITNSHKNKEERYSGNSIPDASSIIISGWYKYNNSTSRYYTTKEEALRQRKNDLLRELIKLKKEAFTTLEKVSKFREKHWEDLNIKLVDSELERLKDESL